MALKLPLIYQTKGSPRSLGSRSYHSGGLTLSLVILSLRAQVGDMLVQSDAHAGSALSGYGIMHIHSEEGARIAHDDQSW